MASLTGGDDYHRNFERIEELLRTGNNNTSLFGGNFSSTKSSVINALVAVARGSTEVEQNFHRLARSGATFDNNLFGISSAVAKTRMDFREFSDFMQDQGKNLTGLGGSVTRGTEQFVKLSDTFQQEAKSLRYLNYTTKEMNDLLALTVSTRRVVDMNDATQRASVIKSAEYLGTNLDKLAKLTGRQREDLLNQLADKQRLSSFNSKMELMRRTMNEKEFAAYEESVKAQLAYAESVGQGSSYMELVTKGYVSSAQAAMELQLQGPGNLIGQAAIAFNKGLTDTGNELMKQGVPKALEVANSNQVLMMNTVSEDLHEFGGVISSISQKTDSVLKGANATIAPNERYARDMTQALSILEKQVEASQKGLDENGNRVNQFYTAAVDISTALEGVKAGTFDIADNVKIFNTSVVDLSNKMASIASSLTPENSEQSVAEFGDKVAGVLKESFGDTFSVDAIKQGLTTITDGAGDSFKQKVTEAGNDFASMLTKSAAYLQNLPANAANNNTDVFSQVVTDVVDKVAKPRHSGSLGATGNITENFGSGTLIMGHGDGHEGMVTTEQTNNLANGSMQLGIQRGIQSSFDMFKQFAANSERDLRPVLTEYEKNSDNINKQLGSIVTTIISNPNNNTGDIDKSIQSLSKIFTSMDATITANATSLSTLSNITSSIQQQVDNVNITPTSPNINTPNTPKLDLNSLNLSTVAPGLQNHQPQPTTAKPDTTKQAPPEDKKTTAAVEENNKTLNAQNALMTQVLEQLKTLNGQFSQFVHQHEALGSKQVKATKNIGPNLYPQ